jgi:hypothetical protein
MMHVWEPSPLGHGGQWCVNCKGTILELGALGELTECGAPTPDPVRHMILLTELGDIEVAWDSGNDEAMRTVIQQKMQEGVAFFVLKPVFKSSFYRKTKLTDIKDLKEQRVKVNDADLEKLFASGQAHLARVEGATYETGQRLKTPEAVAKAPASVGFKAMRGG